MKILVCIKQVPDTQKVQIDPETGVLIREGIETKMNPYDLIALETGMQILKKMGGTLDVLTMGPPAAEEVLMEAIALGAKEAWLMSDRRFAGADVLATSYTLAQGIQAMEKKFDLILCGMQTTDGDTAQVGPSIAEVLEIPHVSWVKKIESVSKTSLIVQQEQMDAIARIEVSLPCLLTVEKGIVQPRLPSYIKKRTADRKMIHWMTLDQCPDRDPKRYGLNGSATQVERMFEPEASAEAVRWEKNSDENAALLAALLKKKKFIQGGNDHGRIED